ncbi:MAG: hypothetical protein ACRESX_02580 [Gammaproteobacteria bacterium]
MKRLMLIICILLAAPAVNAADHWVELKYIAAPSQAIPVDNTAFAIQNGATVYLVTYIDMDNSSHMGESTPFIINLKDVMETKDLKHTLVIYEEIAGYCPYEAQTAESNLMEFRVTIDNQDVTSEVNKNYIMEERLITAYHVEKPILFDINQLDVPSNNEIYHLICDHTFMPN